MALATVALLTGCSAGADTPAAPPASVAASPSPSPSPSPSAASPPGRGTDAPRTPEGAFLITDFGADTVTFVDPARRGEAAVLDSVEVGTGPIDPARDDGPSLTVRSPGGRERLVPLDGPHESVTLSADGRTAYVSGGFTGTVTGTASASSTWRRTG